MMSGADRTATEALLVTDLNPSVRESPSLPLYAAGLVIMLSAVLAANAALTLPDFGWMESTLFLTGLGFLFSYGSRGLAIKPQTVDFVFATVILLLLAGVVTGRIVPEQFLPVGADSPALRLLAALVWGGTIWTWALRSDTRVMLITVPAMAVLGLAASQDLNDPVLVCFGLFILAVIFLLIHQNYLQNRVRAMPSERPPAPARLLLAQFAQTGLCGLAVLLAGLAVIVPAQAVFSHLSLAQAIRLLTTYKPGSATGNAALRFSDEDTLAIGTGATWPSSAEVVMQVTPSDGQEHYWRGRTYDLYTGDGWESTLENQKEALADGSPLPDGVHVSYLIRPDLMPGDVKDPAVGPLMTAAFRVLGDTGQFYSAANPHRIILRMETAQYGQGVRAFRDGRLDLINSLPVRSPYAISSQPLPDVMQDAVQDRLRRSGTRYPPEVQKLYLGVSSPGITQPADLAFFQKALFEALQTLPPSRRDPLDEALAIRAWVSHRCVYSLAPPPIPDDADHVRAFLDVNRRGYCDMFASSMAILCRAAGIPARLATGFAPGDRVGDTFNLRGEDKHAWTEVYFPGTGWVTFDATAGSVTDGSVPRARIRTQSNLRDWLRRLRLGLDGDWKLVYPLVALILLIVGYVLKTEFYDRWRAKRRHSSDLDAEAQQTPRTALGRQYRRLTRALARLGLPRRPSETPAEYAARAVPLLAVLERELSVPLPPGLFLALTGAFTQTCYAGPAASPLRERDWDPEVARFEAAVRRAVWARWWQTVMQRASYPSRRPNKA